MNTILRRWSSSLGKKILLTGSNGQIGRNLITSLYSKYGKENVVAADISKVDKNDKKKLGKYYELDVTQIKKLENIVSKEKINMIINLAAILSAKGEQNHEMCRHINNVGFENCLDIAKKYKCLIFSASSIAAFGDKVPKFNIPEDPPLLPKTMYGITKVYSELLGKYYFDKFGVDFRCFRFPVVLSSEEFEHSGTAHYALDIVFNAIRKKPFSCYIAENTAVPMIHMDDVVKSIMQLIETDRPKLTRCTYSLAGLSISPKMVNTEIKKFCPDFQITYKPDFRNTIAESWPGSLAEPSNKDFGWNFSMTVSGLVEKLYKEIKTYEDKRIAQGLAPKK